MRICTTIVALLLLLLTACQSDGSSTANPSSGQATPGTSEPTGTTSPSADNNPAASTAPTDGEPSGPGANFGTNSRADPDFPQLPNTSELVLSGARLAQHQGYDRVVFDLSGKGVPGYRVQYVDEAIADGSGAKIPLYGDAILQVILTGVQIPAADAPAPSATPIGDLAVLAEVHLGPPFEGQSTSYIGLTEKSGFRAFTLQNPSRLVVDIEHP